MDELSPNKKLHLDCELKYIESLIAYLERRIHEMWTIREDALALLDYASVVRWDTHLSAFGELLSEVKTSKYQREEMLKN